MCGDEHDIIKSHKDAAREEICPRCDIVMQRIYTIPGLNFATLTQSEKQDLARQKGETGSDLICIGNERAALRKIAPKMDEYTLPREVEAQLHAV
jgi:predicted nucleic acid-binding Zn ribbon protein